MASVIDLYVDLRNRKLVSGVRASAISGGGDWIFPKVWHNENLQMRWRFFAYNTSGDPKEPNTYMNLGGAALTVSIFTTDGAITLATTAAGGWTASTDGNFLTGNLNLNTVNMAAQFAPTVPGVLSIIASLEIQLVMADATYAFRTNITIDKSFIAGATPANITSAGYLTREEALALFVKYYGNPDGATVTLVSPDGLTQGIIGVNDDGSFKMDVV